ncbi:MAG: flagellar assembly protein H [Leptolyngbyaceae cyanobacterium RU_5_1]|nr:flagellar assembly protein H [Leptolyngbyaceae cyanobacterium RU_5_1]
MTQIPFDQLAKEFLQELLTPLGQVERSFEVPGEPKFVDVWFQPTASPTKLPTNLTLLERITSTPCSFEPFRNAPTRQEIRRCLLKLLWVQEYELRKDNSIPEAQLPMLWILASSVSQPVLNDAKADLRRDWLPGIYFCGNVFKTAIVAINQLPKTADTLWLRILGRDATQEQAILEVLALPTSNPQRSRILQMLTSWKIRIEMTAPLDREDEQLLMALSQAYLDWEKATEQRGKREVVEALLKTRFIELDAALAAIVPQILTLPTEEYTSLILQLSREQLLARFSANDS